MSKVSSQRIRVVDDKLINRLIKEARQSPRKRANFRFHEYKEKVQRMVNVLLKGTYVTPHKHHNPDKVEHFICIKGKVAFVNHNNKGEIDKVFILQPDGPVYSVDIEPNIYHMFVCLKEPAVLIEIVEGPYDEKTHKKFADFAPREDSIEAARYLRNIEQKIRGLNK